LLEYLGTDAAADFLNNPQAPPALFTIYNHLSISYDLREIGIDRANWIQLARDRVQWRDFVNTVTKLRVP